MSMCVIRSGNDDDKKVKVNSEVDSTRKMISLLMGKIDDMLQKGVSQTMDGNYCPARKVLVDCLDVVKNVQEQQLQLQVQLQVQVQVQIQIKERKDKEKDDKTVICPTLEEECSRVDSHESSDSIQLNTKVTTTSSPVKGLDTTTKVIVGDTGTTGAVSTEVDEECRTNERIEQMRYHIISIPLRMKSRFICINARSVRDGDDGTTAVAAAASSNIDTNAGAYAGVMTEDTMGSERTESDGDVLLCHDFYFAVFNLPGIGELYDSPEPLVIVTVTLLFNIAITYHKEGAYDGRTVSYQKALQLYKSILNTIKRCNRQSPVFPLLLRVLLATCHNIAHIYKDGFGNNAMCCKFIEAGDRVEQNLMFIQTQRQHHYVNTANNNDNNNNSTTNANSGASDSFSDTTVLLPAREREFFAMNKYFAKISSGCCAQAA